MKKFLYFLFSLLIIACQSSTNDQATSQDDTQTTVQAQNNDEIAFDSTLAQKLEADVNGMSPYVMAFLKKGPNREQDSLKRAELQTAHMNNIQRMADEGKLVLAGPFMDNGDIRGIYIFNVKSIEEAKALTATDPAIQSGSLVMELHPWYGSAAVKMVNEWHQKVAKALHE